MSDNISDKLESIFLQHNDTEICIILCTAPNDTCAQTIAHSLLINKLAACVTLLSNAKSFYYWQGTFKQQDEVQMLIKSRMALQQEVFTHIKDHHPYQKPELLVIPNASGDPDYLSWLNYSLY